MKARGVLLSLLATATVGVDLVQPHAAMAKPGYEVKSPSFGVGFRMQGSHGFDLSVAATGHKRVTLTASKGLMSATYTVPGRATRKRIDADFGSLGRISVRFDGAPAPKAKKTRRQRRSCRGRPTIRFRGIFHGTIRFRGEHGYTSVNTRRARGSFYRSFRRVCKKRSWKPGLPPPGKRRLAMKRPSLLINTLIAESKGEGRSTGFAIIQLKVTGGAKRADPGSLSFVIATQGERTGRVAIARSLLTVGDEGSLLVGDPGIQPVTATVALSKPFSGTANYREEAGLPPSWTGDFGVWLPGAGVVPLTGEGFKAGLCQARSERQFTTCLRRLDKSFGRLEGAAQDSGSQSQLFGDARLSWSR